MSVGSSKVKVCLDSIEELAPTGAARLAGLIEQNFAELVSAECRMLRLACAWADAHYLDPGAMSISR